MKCCFPQRAALIVFLAMLPVTHTSAALQGQSENWPRFRGPNGTGISKQKGLPVKWADSDYEWNIAVPGLGHSSPIVWANRLFLTTAEKTGDVSARKLLCLDANTGQILWTRNLALASSHLHKKNSWASGTPTTDGNFVYAVFADDDAHTLVAFDFEGEEKWRRNLGAFESQHGQGASPIIYQDLVILPNDQIGPSQVTAFNKITGEVVWNSDRETQKTSYATPMIHRGKSSVQIICVSDSMGVTSLNPQDGKLNWRSSPFPMRLSRHQSR